jgi:hypothetical protein
MSDVDEPLITTESLITTEQLTEDQQKRDRNISLVFTWAWFAGAVASCLFMICVVVLLFWYPIYWLIQQPLRVLEVVAVSASLLMLLVAFAYQIAKLF